ncbi:Survival factor 1 [Cyphellophora attinorum]|uniref:Survival factor 1 n=1 Tax=Cyphellophora attinorum TaxID=1664694 RepID=A0A0N1HNJ4_9EURO|nr:Survival factor 1 [Phialophora attinorum]KPI39114.1 Survival factor 1 [Phialophora attinorum]
MNWFKQQLAHVAGTQEPEYGPDAIQPVTKQTPQYTELTSNDLKWVNMGGTNVETAVFYFMTDEGVTGLAQIIYSSVAGVHTTAHFNSKIFDHDGPGKHFLCSDSLNNYGFDDAQTGFVSDEVAVQLNAEGDTFTIKSAANDGCLVNLTVKRAAPGFHVGKNGTTYYGTDPAKPWGSMFHRFWPRCTATGTMKTEKKTYDFKGQAMYIKAIQGMKPHHAAAKWNFIWFNTPTYSASVMEFTTPASYDRTTVSVGSISKNGELIYAGPTTVKHTKSETDAEISWPEPKAIEVHWKGNGASGKPVDASLISDLPPKVDRVDVLHHIPGFVKTIVGGVVGTKPYIYQYISKDAMTLDVDDKSENGQLFMEATFISD